MRIKQNHPLNGMVTHLIKARKYRHQRNKRKSSSKDICTYGFERARTNLKKESDFVKFMNLLEKRGPDTPFNLYDSWTVAIRLRMEKKGSWPTGDAKWDINIVAQYMQELQRQFWNTVPKLLKKKALRANCADWPVNIFSYLYRLRERKVISGEEMEDMNRILSKSLDAFEMIHDKIRMKGLRTRRFIVAKCLDPRSLTRIYIGKVPSDPTILKWVWSTCNWSIMWPSFKIPPVTLVMPHAIKQINVCRDPQVTKDAFIQKGEVLRF